MLVWLLIGAVVLLLFYMFYGWRWVQEAIGYAENRKLFKAVEGGEKIYGDAVNLLGEVKGVADTIAHGKGSLWSRSIGAFDTLVP